MDIKIGFTENPRELVIAAGEDREELVSKISKELQSERGILELTDAKGHTFFINSAEVAYVEVASSSRPAVGFGGV